MSRRGQCARVAVCENPRAISQEFSTKGTHLAVDPDVFGQHLVRLFQQGVCDLAWGVTLQVVPFRTHAFEGPKQIHGGGSAGSQNLDGMFQGGGESLRFR